MSIIPSDVMCFDVERSLAKALAVRVETYLVDIAQDEFKFRIGQRWNLRVSREQLEQLWSDLDSQQALRDTFDSLKSDWLAFQSFSKHN